MEKYLENRENLIKIIENETENKRLKCLNLWIWITKGLVLRQHSLLEFFSKKVYIFSDIKIIN